MHCIACRASYQADMYPRSARFLFILPFSFGRSNESTHPDFPLSAKARDAQIVQLMAKMVKPLKDAVAKVEVDTSVPTFLEKINPFSSDGESFNCASCK